MMPAQRTSVEGIMFGSEFGGRSALKDTTSSSYLRQKIALRLRRFHSVATPASQAYRVKCRSGVRDGQLSAGASEGSRVHALLSGRQARGGTMAKLVERLADPPVRPPAVADPDQRPG